MTEISDVDVYFKRLYSKSLNPPPITVDEFLDIMTKCKDSIIPKERVINKNIYFMTKKIFVFFLFLRKSFKME
jgi:hypothetical protein